ncbi:MAG TPA: hypothetical protein VN033_06480 [Vulgatibacter sp.]|nr:hypothetical protein [Vulgatibacter sp.]
MDRKRADTLLPHGRRDDVTRELTGRDADMDEAEVGSAGNGADPFGADLEGGLPVDVEAEPDRPDDIVPDEIVRWPDQPADRDLDLTARPSEPPPIDPSET